MKVLVKIIRFLKEVRIEIKRVNWPTKQETLRYTLIVVGVSVVIAAFLGGVDFTFRLILDKFLL